MKFQRFVDIADFLAPVGIRTFRSSVFSLLGAKVPTENFVPGSESSREHSLPGTKVPGNSGTKVPGNFRSRVSKFAF